MFQTIIFDLDGTLLNTLDDMAHACNHTLTVLGYPVHPAESYKQMVGNGIPVLVSRMLPPEHRGDSTQQLALSLFHRYYAQSENKLSRPYPGILPMLENLHSRGIQLAVASNKAEKYMPGILQQFFPGLFKIGLGLSEERKAKPAPDILFAILNELGQPPQNCLFCGDSDVDILTAKNAGITSCGVLWGYRTEEELKAAGADFLINSPDELLPIALA